MPAIIICGRMRWKWCFVETVCGNLARQKVRRVKTTDLRVVKGKGVAHLLHRRVLTWVARIVILPELCHCSPSDTRVITVSNSHNHRGILASRCVVRWREVGRTNENQPSAPYPRIQPIWKGLLLINAPNQSVTLASRGANGIGENVLLMRVALYAEPYLWKKVRGDVAGRIVDG